MDGVGGAGRKVTQKPTSSHQTGKGQFQGVLDITESISSALRGNLGQKILMMEGQFDNYGEQLENAEVLKLAISRLDSELFLLSF